MWVRRRGTLVSRLWASLGRHMRRSEMRQEVRSIVMAAIAGDYLTQNTVSLYFKQKLRTQYANALDDAKKELV